MSRRLADLPDAEFDAYMQAQKICSRCKRSFERWDFPTSKARGKTIIRSWCAECLAAYYRDRQRVRKETAQPT